MTICYKFECCDCKKELSENLNSNYRRLEETQKWICDKCKEKTDRIILEEEPFKGGFIIKIGDY